MADPTWGMRFNERPDYERIRKGERPEGCPEWFESQHIRTWQEKGLILWNSVGKKIETLGASETLTLLTDLNSQDAWKSQGVSIVRLFHQIPVSVPTRVS